MKYCPNCGNQLNGNETVCPKCGAKIGENVEVKPEVVSNGARPKLVNRNAVTAIILSIVTCGIYGLIWMVNLVDDVNTLAQDEHSNQSGITVLLLTIVTCGIYGMIWFYQAGKRMEEVGKKYGVSIADNSIIYLVLLFFGLGIVDYYLLQTDLNKFAE